MKAKIFGILVSLMLMTAFLTTAQNVENIQVKNESEEINEISFEQIQAPVWEVGYDWTYKIDRFILDFEDSGLSVYVDIKIDNFYVEVTKVTEDDYELAFEAGVTGTFWIDFDLGDGPINISFDLKSATIEGTILLNKTDLGIKQIHPRIYGTLDIKIEEQPYIKFPFKLSKDIVGTIDLEIVMGNVLPIIKFPFEMGIPWGIPETTFTVGGTIESPLFEDIDNINRKVVNPLLTIINNTVNLDIIERLKEFSDILLDVLPIINISKILNDYLDMEIEFIIPSSGLDLICCLDKDIITVPAGTFECYNISLAGTYLTNMYYNDTEVKNIVKVVGNLQDIFPSISNINVELISYNTWFQKYTIKTTFPSFFFLNLNWNIYNWINMFKTLISN